MKPCVKLAFGSRGDAKAYAKRLRDTVHATHAYLCPSCGCWHLTSQSKAEMRSARRKRRERAA